MLRFKNKDQQGTKYAYTIDKEWFPRPQDAAAIPNRSNTAPTGTLPTPQLSPEEKDKQNRSIIVSGIKKPGVDPSLSQTFLDFLEESDRALVEDVTIRKNNILIVLCRDWLAGNRLVGKYNKKKLLDFTINLSLFASSNPSSN